MKNKLKEKILKKREFEVEFGIIMDLVKEVGHSGFVVDSLKRKINQALDSMREEIAEDICKIIDRIELSYKDTSLDEWKAFKGIRNRIRDKYLKIN